MTAAALAFPTPASLGSLDQYIQAVNRFPLLTAEQEVEFGRRLQQHDDIDAARQMVLSHLRLVVAVSQSMWATACRRPTSFRKATSD